MATCPYCGSYDVNLYRSLFKSNGPTPASKAQCRDCKRWFDLPEANRQLPTFGGLSYPVQPLGELQQLRGERATDLRTLASLQLDNADLQQRVADLEAEIAGLSDELSRLRPQMRIVQVLKSAAVA